jgi:hypothetical protein
MTTQWDKLKAFYILLTSTKHVNIQQQNQVINGAHYCGSANEINMKYEQLG